LPGTGWRPRAYPAVAPAPVAAPAAPGEHADPLAGLAAGMIGLALLGGALGLLLLVAGLAVRMRRPLHGGGFARSGVGLMLLSLMVFLAGWALFPAETGAVQRLSLLRGVKPPLATAIALPELPPPAIEIAATPTAETAAQPIPPLSEVTEAPVNPEAVQPTNTPDPRVAASLPTSTPNTLPNYPIPAPTGVPAQGPGGIEPDVSPATRLVIPSLGLDTVIKYVPYSGKTWLIGGLRREVAWMGDTSWPGLGSNTGFAGHVDLADGSSGPFWNLKDLKPGDVVQIYTQRHLYTYRVRELQTVDDHNLNVVGATTHAQVTLITCTDFDPGLGVYLSRLVAYADLASVQTLTGAVSGN
jgi:LPXTG-site transpeptidase (sortase) family protein